MKSISMKFGLNGLAKVSALGATALLLLTVQASAQVLYNSLPTATPTYDAPAGSLGFQADQTSEFGDEIGLTTGGDTVTGVTIGLSSWATASTFLNPDNSVKSAYSYLASSLTPTGYYVPLTLNIYNVVAGSTPTVGSLITTQTVNTFVPWRPENNPSNNDEWLAPDENYYPGLYSTVTFNTNVILPQNVIVTLAFNTQNFGSSPTGLVGPYNSLNFALNTGNSVGTDINSDAVFWNTSNASNYADGGASGVGTLRQDTTWTGQVPAIQVVTAPEPSTYVLLGFGLGLLFMLRRSARRTPQVVKI